MGDETKYKNKRKFDASKSGYNNKSNKKDDDPEQSASNKKRALKHARQSHRPHFESVTAAKELWNKLRVKSNTPAQIKDLMEELMTLLTGKFHRVAMQHDASRVVQAALQFGTEKQKLIIVKELCAGGDKQQPQPLLELAKVQYAHFVLLKIIKNCSKNAEIVRIVVKALKGQIPKLAVHAVGARVIELLFATFPSKAIAPLKVELYGPRFALFTDSGDLSNTKTTTPTLSSILQNQNESGKTAALEFVLGIITKGIDKSLFSFAYFQQLLSEYTTTASPNSIQSITSSLVDHSIHLLSTKAGAKVVAQCATYGTAKDRKRIMRSLKGYTRSSLLHSDAYIAILRVLDVVDDTVTAQKSILAELSVLVKEKKKLTVDNKDDDDDEEEGDEKSPLLDLALSETGSKLFLHLLVQDDERRKKYFDPSELEVMHPNPVIIEDSKEVPTSKKSAASRRKELVQYMKNGLVELCTKHSNLLLRSRCGAKVLREVYQSFPSTELVSTIVSACEESLNEEVSLFENQFGHLALKNIIMSENESDSSPLALALYEAFEGDLLKKIGSSNRGAFILSAMVPNVPASEKELTKKKEDIEKRLEGDGSNAGYKALMKALEGEGK